MRSDARYSTERLSTVYLRLLRQYALAMLKLKLKDAVAEHTPIEYISTVPAIWDEAATAKTIDCAKGDGMGITSNLSPS